MYTPTIGLEVHAELKTKSKMFCGCPNDPHGSEANQNICPICLAHPGTLPVANVQAVKQVITLGVAVGGTIATYAEFDRKNYFYPDIPKAYQISQYAFPFVRGGTLSGIALTRVHLEEDTARSQHDKGDQSLVDFNRAGVPLMELVTEPDIHDAKTAGAFARELQLLLRSLGISDANMERGEMRVEANISVSATTVLGTKVEVKNLNSFKSVEAAIDYEIKRQIDILESGQILVQETRGWDEQKGKTFSQRAKETAKDYRYFPDPDLPKLFIPEFTGLSLSRQDDIFNKTPAKKREIYRNLGLTDDTTETIIQSNFLAPYFETLICVSAADGGKSLVLATNFLLNDLAPLVGAAETPQQVLSAVHLYQLLSLVTARAITSRVAKDVIIALALADQDPMEYITEHNLGSQFSDDALVRLVADVLSQNASVVVEYKAGKAPALQYLLGQAMKQSRGSIEPGLIKDALMKAIG